MGKHAKRKLEITPTPYLLQIGAQMGFKTQIHTKSKIIITFKLLLCQYWL